MPLAVLTTDYREKLADHCQGGPAVIPPESIAFGDGGESGGEVLTEDPAQIGLNNELLRKPLDSVGLDGSDVVCIGRLEQDELNGETISEIAIFDAIGKLISVRNFSGVEKESGFQLVEKTYLHL